MPSIGPSTLNLNGGGSLATAARIEGSSQTLRGIVNVTGNGRFNIQTDFTSSVDVSLAAAADTLSLGDDSIIRAGADFIGSGAVVNLNGSTLTIEDGVTAVDLAVLLENRGDLVVGASPGLVQGTDFQQSSSGSLEIEIMGLALNQFDRLNLTQSAVIAGELDLSLLGGFAPTLGNTFNFLGATFGASGAFDNIVQPPTMPAGLEFIVNDFGTFWQLEVVNSVMFTADFDMDGDVDAGDLAQWEGDYGVNGNSDADGDGDSDGNDFLAWQEQFGSGLPRIAGPAAMPEPSTLVMASLAALALIRPKRS